MVKAVAVTIGMVTASVLFSACGSVAASPPKAQTVPHSTATHSILPSHLAPSGQAATPSGVVRPAPKPSAAAIYYTISQLAYVVALGKSSGLGDPFVPRKGVDTKFLGVTVYSAATDPTARVLLLSYNNVIVQETGTARALAGGGDQRSTAITLTVPGSGSSKPIRGIWTQVFGIQGSGKRSVLTFPIHGTTIQIASSVLSPSQMLHIAESLSQS